jgi:hypothetical protein
MSLQRWHRPTVNTKFMIDLTWWDRMDRDFYLYLRTSLCSSCRTETDEEDQLKQLDFVDPETAEVRRISVLWNQLITCCSQNAEFITPSTPLKEAIFRALLASGNTPLSPIDLQERIGKSDPETILRVLSSGPISYGIIAAELENH